MTTLGPTSDRVNYEVHFKVLIDLIMSRMK
jgi:hypothetical protein